MGPRPARARQTDRRVSDGVGAGEHQCQLAGGCIVAAFAELPDRRRSLGHRTTPSPSTAPTPACRSNCVSIPLQQIARSPDGRRPRQCASRCPRCEAPTMHRANADLPRPPATHGSTQVMTSRVRNLPGRGAECRSHTAHSECHAQRDSRPTLKYERLSCANIRISLLQLPADCRSPM